MKIIPGSMQFKQIAIVGEYTELPADLRHRVKFTAVGVDKSELFNITLDAMQLSNQRIALSYEPETVEDQQIIDSYGGLDNTPAYLVRLRPVLKLNGERLVVAQDGLPMGAEYTLAMEVISPNGVERVSNTHIVGNLAVIGVVSQLSTNNTNLLESDDAEAILFKEANAYIGRWNKAEDELSSLLKVSVSRPLPAIVIIGGLIDVTYLLDAPHGFEWKGVFIDAALRGIEAVSRTADISAEKSFMRLSALQGSILENRIFEDDFKVESISTAKLLAQATSNGMQMVVIDKSNIDALLPTLPYDDDIKADIGNAVNQGLTVTIPQAEITYHDWTGVGYVKENPATGESGWMLTGMVAGGMTVWSPDQWDSQADKAMSAALRAPFSGKPNTDPASAALILKIPVTDQQQGTVGQPLNTTLQVKVLDKQQKPVEKASVTFTIKAGGGLLGQEKVTSKTEKTNKNGIAKISLTLGEKTSDNPVFWSTDGRTYADQYGANIVDATLDNGVAVTTPFTAYGKPGPVDHLRPTHGDNTSGRILSFAGFVSLMVEDSFNNPIANQPIKFTIGTPTGSAECNLDETPAKLVKTDDPCINGSPTINDLAGCVSAKTAIDIQSQTNGSAAAQVILGGAPEAVYPITATSSVGNKTLSSSFKITTYPFVDCKATAPAAGLVTTYVFPADTDGRSINAGRTGSYITLMAKEYLIKENEKKINETLSCNESTLTCQKIVGNRTFTTDTDFTAANILFNKAPGQDKGKGVFQTTYILNPGLNRILIEGQAVKEINRTANNCTTGCSGTITEPKTYLAYGGYLEVYGVDINIKKPLQVLLDGNNFSRNNLKIAYTIAPADYQAYSALIRLYKGNDIIEYIPTETKEKGTGTITKGYWFDPNANYWIQVVLNNGTGVQIESDKVPLTIAKGALVADYDHNRKIDDKDLDRVMNNEPYYFWVNDDDGSGDTEGSGIPGSGNNQFTTKIAGTRDIVDWFPVNLDIADMVKKFDPAEYTYALKQASERLRFVYTDLTPSVSGNYLTDVPTAQNLVNTAVIYDVTNLDGLTSRTSLGFNRLNTAFLQKIKDEGKGILLFEGVGKSTSPLLLEVYDKDSKKVFDISLNISIDGIEKMFRHKNLVQDGGGPPPFSLLNYGAGDRLAEPSNFPDSETNDKHFVFVPGYNVNGEQARGWNAEIFKRMYWSGSRAKFWGVTWYGWDTQDMSIVTLPFTRNFHINVQHALKTAPAFSDFINLPVGGKNVTVAAHSLGNMLVSSAIVEQGANVDKYFLIDAAVPIEAYDGAVGRPADMMSLGTNNIIDGETNNMIHPAWSAYKVGLYASEWYRLFPGDDWRSKLTWRDRFASLPSLTKAFNFYSSGEDVLDNHTGTPYVPDIFTEGAGKYAWALQEKLKGMMPTGWMLGSNYGGWGFNKDGYNEWVIDTDGTSINVVMRPDTINQLFVDDPEQFRAKPFFKLTGDDLKLLAPGTEGSDYARVNRDRLLAEAIPALSRAAGKTSVSKFGRENLFNFDMPTNYQKNGWPREKYDWKHSDIREVSYPYTNKLFIEFIKILETN